MIPIRDSLSLRRPPVMTWILVAGTCVAFVYELMLGEGQLEDLIYTCGIVPARWLDPRWARHVGLPPHDFWPFLTSMFLHGSWLHLIGNVWALWIFGDDVEDRLGSLRYLVFYVLCGLGSGLMHFVSNPYSRVPTIGASGAIAGVMGAFFVMFPRSRVLTLLPIGCFPLFVTLPAVVFLGVWFALQFVGVTATLVSAQPVGGIAWWAHIGGFLLGMALVAVLEPRRVRESPIR